jgi:hypothetical protein
MAGAESPPGDSQEAEPPEFLDLSGPPRGLPEVQFPGFEDDREQREMAEAQRRQRMRVEVYGGVAILVVGVAGTVVFRAPGILALAFMALVAIVAYELLTSSLQ